MKKRSCLWLLCVALVLLLTSCGFDTVDGIDTFDNNIDTAFSVSEDNSKEEVSPKEYYYFILFNSSYLTRQDQNALSQLFKAYPEHDVFILDVKDCRDAFEVYELMRQESLMKDGKLDGVQILGTVNMVPAFLIEQKYALPSGFSTGNAFFSDYFYSNFDNNIDDLQSFNVADHFASERKVSLVPEWKVARLPLGSGDFQAYIDQYQVYLESQTAKPELVGFFSSIFKYRDLTSADDFAYFFQRAQQEWGIVDSIRTYANQQGAFLTPVNVLGDITIENMKKENETGIKEFFISGHGSASTVFRTTFTNEGKEEQTSFLVYNQIKQTFGNNPYFLNFHSCNIAAGMGYNMVRVALNNGCIGTFASTSLIMNNGINCKASLEEMQETSNYFGFYYSYLKGLSMDLSRSNAFFEAQKSFEKTLASCGDREIDYLANYQFGYHNLISYANFGIFEPEVNLFAPSDDNGTNNYGIPSEEIYVYLTNGKVIGEDLKFTAQLQMYNPNAFASVLKVTASHLDNNHVRFRITYKAENDTCIYFLSSNAQYLSGKVGAYELIGKQGVLVVDIPIEEIASQKDMGLYFVKGNGKVGWFISDLSSLT